MERMQDGLDAIEIQLQVDHEHWRDIASELVARNGGGNLGIYFHVSRGADSKRHHAYPEGIAPTIYAFALRFPRHRWRTKAPPLAIPYPPQKTCAGSAAISSPPPCWVTSCITSTATPRATTRPYCTTRRGTHRSRRLQRLRDKERHCRYATSGSPEATRHHPADAAGNTA